MGAPLTERSSIAPRVAIDAARILGVAVLYAITARLGLLLDPVGGFATLVWAPSGIAIAAVVLLGNRVAMGVFAGAVVANLLTGAPVLAALAIGIGNTLEAVVAAYALRRLRFEPSFDRVSDTLAFMLGAAAFAPLLSASIGVASLRAAGVLTSAQVGEAWRAWWVGDFIGALLVGPLILTWHARRLSELSRRRALEALACSLAVAFLAAVVFFDHANGSVPSLLQAYLLFPPLIWAAVRFELRGATTGVFIASLIAIAGTARGRGPFVQPELHDSLFQLQTFMGIVAACFLILGTAVAERARAQRALHRALDAEAAANRSKSDFLAVMSHELRTPLNAIAGYAQLFTMDVLGAVNEKQRDAIERIARNQAHLSTLVEDHLGYTRTEAGQTSVRRERVAVSDALASIETYIGPATREKRLKLEKQRVSRSIAVMADPDRVRQIVLNFLSNAIKYTPEGGRIRVGVEVEGDRTRISVSDTGIGIPEDQIDRVFEPFYQVDRGKTRRFPGVGLGLTIARALARKRGGNVTLQRAEGGGTIATLELPSCSERSS